MYIRVSKGNHHFLFSHSSEFRQELRAHFFFFNALAFLELENGRTEEGLFVCLFFNCMYEVYVCVWV